MKFVGLVSLPMLLLSACQSCPAGPPAAKSPADLVEDEEWKPDPSRTIRSAPFLRLTAQQAVADNGALRPVLRLTISNTSPDQIVWLTYRLLVHARATPVRDVWLDISDDRGNEVVNLCKINAGPPEPWQYMALKPGSEVSGMIGLKCFDLPAQGHVRIVVHYQDINAHPPEPPEIAQWFAGELVSAPVDLVLGN